MTKKCDVLIVGAGPTGLTMALELARRNIAFRIIDKVKTPSIHSKAIAVHARTLECFQDMGILPEVLSHGHKIQQVNTYLNKSPRIKIRLNQIKGTAFAYALMVPQSTLEEILQKALEDRGCMIERGVELKKLSQNKNHVKAVTSDNGASQTIQTKWLIGCDGAHSKVRNELDIPFSGSRYEEQFLVADVPLSGNLNPTHGDLFLNKDFLASFPMTSDRYRLVTPYPSQDTPPSEKHIKEFLEERVKEVCPIALEIGQPTWVSLFNIHRRCVSKMQSRRIFLAGDAAHIHSPIGGQGMNTGIQDAYNLGWKLALYLEGQVSEDFLASYQSERYPVAAKVLLATNLAMKVVLTQTRFLRMLRNFLAPFIFTIPAIRKHLQTLIAETAIHYRTSPIVYHDNAPKDWALTWIKSKIRWGLQPGDRMPDGPLATAQSYQHTSIAKLLAGEKHALFLFLGDAAQEIGLYAKQLEKLGKEFSQFVSAFMVVSEQSIDYNLLGQVDGSFYLDRFGSFHKTCRITGPRLCLVRPDGHVAYLGPAGDEQLFREYLNQHYTLKPVLNQHNEKDQANAQATV